MNRAQTELCASNGVQVFETGLEEKAGIADNVFAGALPINGLRHPPVGDTSGWYIWAGGEPGTEPDYFKPVHLRHVVDRVPGIAKFLALPPGWRFQLAPNHEDVWRDPTLLDL